MYMDFMVCNRLLGKETKDENEIRTFRGVGSTRDWWLIATEAKLILIIFPRLAFSEPQPLALVAFVRTPSGGPFSPETANPSKDTLGYKRERTL